MTSGDSLIGNIVISETETEMTESNESTMQKMPMVLSALIHNIINGEEVQSRFEWHGAAELENGIMRKFVADDGKFAFDLNFQEQPRNKSSRVEKTVAETAAPNEPSEKIPLLRDAISQPEQGMKETSSGARLQSSSETQNDPVSASSFEKITPFNTPPNLKKTKPGQALEKHPDPSPSCSQQSNHASNFISEKPMPMHHQPMIGSNAPIPNIATSSIFPSSLNENNPQLEDSEVLKSHILKLFNQKANLVFPAIKQEPVERTITPTGPVLHIKEEPMSPVPMETNQDFLSPQNEQPPLSISQTHVLLNQMRSAMRNVPERYGTSFSNRKINAAAPYPSCNSINTKPIKTIYFPHMDAHTSNQTTSNRLLPTTEQGIERSYNLKKKRAERKKYSSREVDVLESFYGYNHYPDSLQQRDLARHIQVTPERIKVWFKNRRAKEKRVVVKQEVDAESFCETSTSANLKTTSHVPQTPNITPTSPLDATPDEIQVKPMDFRQKSLKVEIRTPPIQNRVAFTATEQNVLSMLKLIGKDFC